MPETAESERMRLRGHLFQVQRAMRMVLEGGRISAFLIGGVHIPATELGEVQQYPPAMVEALRRIIDQRRVEIEQRLAELGETQPLQHIDQPKPGETPATPPSQPAPAAPTPEPQRPSRRRPPR